MNAQLLDFKCVEFVEELMYGQYRRNPLRQTRDYVVILVEMVHDARIIPLNREHAPKEIRK